MRNIILLLLLANFGVWAFFSWVVSDAPVSESYSGPGITLLRELSPEERRSIASATGASEPDFVTPPNDPEARSANVVGAPGRCISIGPFAEADDADAAMETLLEAGIEPTRTTREAQVWDGYWVYVGEIESMDQAREIQAELAAIDLDDTLVLPNSESGILISLGVFSETVRAMNLAERVRELGFEATIADSLSTTETHWLDVTLTSDESIALELLQEPGRISRLEQMACVDENGD